MSLHNNSIASEETLLAQWAAKMVQFGLCEMIWSENKKQYRIKPPARFNIRPNVLQKLKKAYNPAKEIGGLLFARPIAHGKTRYLDVFDVKLLRNIVVPEHQKYAFWPDQKDAHDAIAECLTQRTDKRRALPIFFHTHPTAHPDESEQAWQFYKEARTSYNDQVLADKLAFNYRGFSFLMPNALVVLNPKMEGQFFIGIFGGGIAPASFAGYMRQLTGKTITELIVDFISWASESDDNAAVAILTSIVVLGSGAYFASDVIPFLATVNELNLVPLIANTAKKHPLYFAQVLNSNESVSIYIPPQKVHR